MALFKVESNQQLEIIKEQPFKLEKEIQLLTETNIYYLPERGNQF